MRPRTPVLFDQVKGGHRSVPAVTSHVDLGTGGSEAVGGEK